MTSSIEKINKILNYYNDHKLYSDQSVPYLLFYREFNLEHQIKYSIVIPVFNQEKIIKANIESVLSNTKDTFEIIIILDACVDLTENILIKMFNTEYQVQNLQRVIIVKQETPVFETVCDNIGFKIATGEYILEIQSDMKMVQPGYNISLARGLQQYDDIIGISGRCTHRFFSPSGIGKLGNLIEKPLDPSLDCDKIYMYGTCNRGPLLLDRKKVQQLNYLDEHNFYLDDSDHDLFARAILTKSWKCGYIPIEFESKLVDGGTRKHAPPDIELFNTKVKSFLKNRPNTSFLYKNKNLLSFIQPQIRPLER